MKTRIPFSENGETPFQKLIGHNPEVLYQWNVLGDVFYSKLSLDQELLEQVRRALAFENGCEYCMALAGKPDINLKDEKIKIAVAFAEMFAMDHKSIIDEHFRLLGEYFSNAQISELCSYISFITACHKLGNIYNLSVDSQQILK
jgi:alkylhydroperoxidase family enzyme